MRLVLYQPDIPQNTGAMLRLAACFSVPIDIIEPCGFILDEPRMKRASLDYGAAVTLTRHLSWENYQRTRIGRMVLLTTKGAIPLTDFSFQVGDNLMLGRESAGVPDAVHLAADARVIIPLTPGMRSLNVAQAAAIALYEGLRQMGSLPSQ